jgi:iron complex transport system ATP-binding protein
VLDAVTVTEFESNCANSNGVINTNPASTRFRIRSVYWRVCLPTVTASSAPLLDFHRVSVMRGDKTALHDITLRIQAGEHVAILGPNGSGKSTLIKTITRECYPLVQPGSSLTIFGRDTWNVFQLRTLLGIVSNDLMAASTRDITAREAVLSGFFSSTGIQPYHHVTAAMAEKARAMLDLLEVPHLAQREMTALSSGEARRILIARALVHDPLALLLDEPSNSLDFRSALELRVIVRKLAQAGTGILLVTHHLADIIPEINRVILLREGRIFADGQKSQMLTSERLTELFGVPVELMHRNGDYLLW